jgi:RHS repeat-associated protein
MTRYAYDPHTFRLKRLRSERYSKPDDLSYHPSGDALQDFGYDYDLIGNILSIQDRTPGSGFLNNPEALTVGDPALAQLLVSGNALNRRFDYDPIYRLLSATGRECDRPPDGEPWGDQPRCTDLTKARAYTETYRYDAMGNMLRLEHRNEPGGFTREYMVETVNNRLRRMQIGQAGYDYTFDVNGNMRSETTSRHFEWNQSDQMKVFRTQTDGAEPSVHAHYLYDSAGQRVKKFVRKQGGRVEVTHYIDGVFEHHRWGNGAQASENNHVHVMDDKRRIALVRLGPAHPDDRGPAVQFHLGDHLGSSNVVVDSAAALVNREEFTPYGETSFGSFARKRYRFTGKERDEESGLSYHGARYYVPSLCRWSTVDPKHSLFPQWSAFVYSFARPLSFADETGRAPTDETAPDVRKLTSQVATVENYAERYWRDYKQFNKGEGGEESFLSRGDNLEVRINNLTKELRDAEKTLQGEDQLLARGLRLRAEGIGEDVSRIRRVVATNIEGNLPVRLDPPAPWSTVEVRQLPQRRFPPRPRPAPLEWPRATIFSENGGQTRPPGTFVERSSVYETSMVVGEQAAQDVRLTRRALGFVRGTGAALSGILTAIAVVHRSFLAGYYIREGQGWEALKQGKLLLWEISPGPAILAAGEVLEQEKKQIRAEYGTEEAEKIFRMSCLRPVNPPSCRQ